MPPMELASHAAPAASSPPESRETARAYAKVFWRLVPFLMLCYVIAYLDRVNVGFAKLQMSQDWASVKPSLAWAPAFSSLATSCSKCPAIC